MTFFFFFWSRQFFCQAISINSPSHYSLFKSPVLFSLFLLLMQSNVILHASKWHLILHISLLSLNQTLNLDKHEDDFMQFSLLFHNNAIRWFMWFVSASGHNYNGLRIIIAEVLCAEDSKYNIKLIEIVTVEAMVDIWTDKICLLEFMWSVTECDNVKTLAWIEEHYLTYELENLKCIQ